VDLKDSVDMLQAGSRNYTWTVSPGVTTLTVSVKFTGTDGLPLLSVVAYGYNLTGGPDGATFASLDPGGFGGVGPGAFGGGGPWCDPCFDAQSEDPGNLPGDWKLHLQWDASEARYDLNVTVGYT
jgi:hypothetical protein